MQLYFLLKNKLINRPLKFAGFTLLELLVAIFIGTIVVSIAGFGIVTVLTMDKKAEAAIERRLDLSQAFDFMTNEIRMARRINRTATTVANGNSITVDDVVSSSGLSLSDLGSYGTIVLYLEIPITATIPSICPADSPNPGLAPPTPADYDRVVYDVRSNTDIWLGPRVINRYGRIPTINGTIDPCSNPISSDILVDSISDLDINPTCSLPAIISGTGGFYVCVNQNRVELYLRNKVSDTEVQNLSSTAVSRLGSSTTAGLILAGTRTPGTNTMNLSWTWTGSSSANFKLNRRVNGVVTEIYSGSGLSTSSILAGNANDLNCYVVTAIVDSSTMIDSNEICEAK